MDHALLERISSLLRRDLKLGPATPITEHTALVGGDMDLDSIDILLVLTSLEKEFGIQLTSDKVSKSAFQTIATLVAFVEQAGGVGATESRPAAPAGAGRDWLAALPHGPSFRFVSEVRSVDPGRRADGLWRVIGDEPILSGHFPGRPIVPGVLISEALAQISGLTAASGANIASGHLAHVDVRFLHAVKPPAEISLRAVVKNSLGSLHQYDVAAEVEGICVASGTVTIHLDGTPDTHR